MLSSRSALDSHVQLNIQKYTLDAHARVSINLSTRSTSSLHCVGRTWDRVHCALG